jgi:polygalacturonase
MKYSKNKIRKFFKKNKRLPMLILLLFFSLLFSIYFLIEQKAETVSVINIPQTKPRLNLQTIPINIFANEKDSDAKNFSLKTINQPVFPSPVCNISDYGAIGDGKTKNTTAFANAIEDCFEKGGGQILVPPGKWLTGPIHFKSNINLYLDKNAEILFSTDFNDYLPVVFSRFEGIEYYNYSPPIYANNCRNIGITGEGTLNGQGQAWWKMDILKSIDEIYAMGESNTPVSERVFGTEEAGLRPSFIQFVNCKNILLENVSIKNGPMWTIHPIYSSDIIIRGITVNTNPGKSTDGIDIDSSRNILLEDSFFNTGDDAIVIKSGKDQDGRRVDKPSENIVVRNCSVINGHAGFAIGSEMSGNVRNVLVYHCNFQGSQYGIRLKGTLLTGGTAENIIIKNITMQKILFDAIQITTQYETALNKEPFISPTFQNITMQNISCSRAKGSITLIGLDNTKIQNIFFKNITISAGNNLIIKNASDIDFNHVTVKSEKKPVFLDTENITSE